MPNDASNPHADADRWITAARTAHDDLAKFISPLDDDDITGPSGCSDWDVAQVLGHLGSGAEIGLTVLQRGLAGEGPPDNDYNQSVWNRWDAFEPRAKVDGFLQHSERLVAAYEGVDDATRADGRIEVAFLPEPIDVAMLVSMRVSELTYHAWDAKAGFDDAAVLHPVPVELMIDHAGLFIGFFGRADNLGRPIALAVETVEPERRFDLRVTDKVEITAPSDQVDGTLRTSAEAWLRLTVGRLRPSHTPAAVRIDSTTVTLDDLRRLFPGI